MEKTVMFQRVSSSSHLSIILFLSYWIVACGGGSNSQNEDPEAVKFTNGYASTAVQTTNFQASIQCPFGGVEIYTGVDVNKNGNLDQDEINNVQEVCHIDADLVMASVEQLEPESACSNGGHKLSLGYDTNQNSLLDFSEVNQSLLFCNQEISTALAITLFHEKAEPEGQNCQYGGTVRQVGLDLNANQILDQTEVSSSEYQCITDNLNISLYPYDDYYFYDYCSSIYCGENDISSYSIILGDTSSKSIARIYDDGIGQVTVEKNEDAPDWLLFSLSEMVIINDYYDYSSNKYVSSGYYDIVLNTDLIPENAIGNSYPVTLTVSDGRVSFNIQKEFTVIKPVRMTFDQNVLEFTESGDGSTQTAYVKVQFDEALPSQASSLSTNYGSQYLKVNRILENGGQYSSFSDDMEVTWVSSDFYEGQTQATLKVDIFDDSFPEQTESYRVKIDFNTNWPYSDFVILASSFNVVISDDNDQEINATLELSSNSIIEGTQTNLEDKYTQVPFTIKFAPAIPQDGNININLSNLTNGNSASSDVGIFCNNYCSTNFYLPLEKGTTEYSGTLYIKADAQKEADEEFQLALGSNSSFTINNLSARFTVVDDDEQPEISFVDTLLDFYQGARVVYAHISLNASTFENVAFSIETGSIDTAIEGVHYDFAVSSPIIIRPGKINFDLPIIIYDENFEANQLEANLTLTQVSGAILSEEKQTLKITFDKIEPYNAQRHDFVVPISSVQATCSGVCASASLTINFIGNDSYDYNDHTSYETLNLSDAYVYKVGTVDSGYVIDGQTAAGSRDLFVAKFTMDKELIWAKQFGTSNSDSITSRFFLPSTSDVLIRSGSEVFLVATDGSITNLNIETASSYSIKGVQKDLGENLYLLIEHGSSYSSGLDKDSDASWSNMLLVKYDTDLNVLWAVEDFSDIKASHGRLEFSYLSLEMSESGVPFVLGRISGQDYLGKVALGSSHYAYDYAAFSFNPETGAANSYERFGSDGNDHNTLLSVPFSDDQILVYFNVSSGDVVNGLEASNSKHVAKIILDSNGAISSQSLVQIESDSTNSISSIFKSVEGKYYIFDSNSYYSSKTLSILDESLNTLFVKVFPSSGFYPFLQAPIASEDGGYFVIDTNNSISKMTSNFNLRN